MCADGPLCVARPVRLAIVGGGLGGLALAHYVQRSTNFQVQVFDRLPEHSSAAGYRMRIGREGILALKECLPTQLFNLFVATSVASTGLPKFLNPKTMELFKEHDPLAWLPPQPTAQPTANATATGSTSASNASSSSGGGSSGGKPEAIGKSTSEAIPSQVKVNRNTLREVLLSSLAPDRVQVHHGLTFLRYEYIPHSSGYKLYFHSASPPSTSTFSSSECAASSSELTFDADLLIGADGIHSSVRSQWQPSIQLSDAGGRLIYSKLSLTPSIRLLLPTLSVPGYMHAFPRQGNEPFVVTDSMEFRHVEAEVAMKSGGSVDISPLQDYLYFAAVANSEWMESDLRVQAKDPKDTVQPAAEQLLSMSGEELLSLLKRRLSHWHPEIQSAISLCDPSMTAALKVRTALPFRFMLSSGCSGCWPVVPLLLGDALHPMTPTGQGATLALQDAATLGAQLLKLANRQYSLSQAIAAYYETSMDRGMKAVRTSQAGGATMFGQPPLPGDDQVIVINAQPNDEVV